MFAEEKPYLRPLPIEPFRFYEHGLRSVHPDGCIEVSQSYYSAPPGMIGKQVLVQWNESHVRIIDINTNQLLREHIRVQRGRYCIRREDRPKKTPPTTENILLRAERLGKSIGLLCRRIHQAEGEYSIRRIQGVLALTKKYGIAFVDDACSAALELNLPTYRFVQRYLERSTNSVLTLKQVDPIIRRLSEYRDLLNNIT